jgi:hypothetical protein
MSDVNTIIKLEIRHKDYNLDHKDNLHELPEDKAVFAIFGIVDGEPVNCRLVGETENLQKNVRSLFERPASEGLKKFMQGAWLQMLIYELMPGSSASERQTGMHGWMLKYNPAIDEEGEYPGYYTFKYQ